MANNALTLQTFLLRMLLCEKKSKKIRFTPSQSTLKNRSKNRPWTRGLSSILPQLIGFKWRSSVVTINQYGRINGHTGEGYYRYSELPGFLLQRPVEHAHFQSHINVNIAQWLIPLHHTMSNSVADIGAGAIGPRGGNRAALCFPPWF